jgi:hypothetical protein
VLNLVIESADGRIAVHLRSDVSGADLTLRPGPNVLTTVIEELPLVAGYYWLWLRVVSLDPTEPLLWDTERIPLLVNGDHPMESIVLPRHHFEEHSERQRRREGLAIGLKR